MGYSPPYKVSTISVATETSGYIADYYTDGTADDVQIQAALDSIASTGGKIKLFEGTYNIGVDVYIGEVGTTQNTGGNPSTDAARATQITNLYTIFSSKPYFKGINYFQAVGGGNPSSEDIMNYSTYALLPLSSAAIAAFY